MSAIDFKCADCPYNWQDPDDDFSRCHYDYDDGYAPCEIEEPYYDEPEPEPTYELPDDADDPLYQD